jgi:transposase
VAELSREQKIAKAQQLRREGHRLREIAEAFGIDTSTVWKWLNPERTSEMRAKDNSRPGRRERERELVLEKRRNCPSCGNPMGVWSARNGATRCHPCYSAERLARTAERGHQIEGWWAEGLTQKQIAERLGWTVGHLCMEFHRLRSKGFDLPYRYTEGKRAGHKFPEQVSA